MNKSKRGSRTKFSLIWAADNLGCNSYIFRQSMVLCHDTGQRYPPKSPCFSGVAWWSNPAHFTFYPLSKMLLESVNWFQSNAGTFHAFCHARHPRSHRGETGQKKGLRWNRKSRIYTINNRPHINVSWIHEVCVGMSCWYKRLSYSTVSWFGDFSVVTRTVNLAKRSSSTSQRHTRRCANLCTPIRTIWIHITFA